ncbi:MAG: tyrosine--tRNA ligase [Microthrixaceae bacterium]
MHTDRGVDLQVAGSDQWGNITAGVDLIRRRTGDVAHGLTAPLIVRSDGSKFGKSEGENIWLSADRTSPYQMYQYLLNVPDDDVEDLLARLTTVPVPECREVGASHLAAPEKREGQRRLAREVVALIHGPEVVPVIEAAAAVWFGGSVLDAAADTLEMLAGETPSTSLAHDEVVGADPLELFCRTPWPSPRARSVATPRATT